MQMIKQVIKSTLEAGSVISGISWLIIGHSKTVYIAKQ